MANQLFTMLAKLNILQGNIDNYNVYIYILMILYILRFYLFTGLLTVVKYSKVHSYLKLSKTPEMPQMCVGSILCWYNSSSGKAETLVSIKYPILHACTISIIPVKCDKAAMLSI